MASFTEWHALLKFPFSQGIPVKNVVPCWLCDSGFCFEEDCFMFSVWFWVLFCKRLFHALSVILVLLWRRLFHALSVIWGSALKKSVSCSQCDFGFCFGRLWKTVSVGLFSDAPAPQQLVLERQLTNSVLISWRVPHGLDPGSIQAYHVYLNGVLKATLKGLSLIHISEPTRPP